MRNVPWVGVRAAARHELRHRASSLLVLGLTAGLFAGLAFAISALLLRTDSAYDRLVAATDLSDARVGTYNILNTVADARGVFDGTAGARAAIETRNDLVASQQLDEFYVRRNARAVTDFGLWAPQRPWTSLDRPVIAEGRFPADDAVDEVMVSERAARDAGTKVGDRLTVRVFAATQLHDFDRGLTPPRLGRITLRVVGLFRSPVLSTGFNGYLAGPAFAAKYEARGLIGAMQLLRLDPRRPAPAIGDQVDLLNHQLVQLYGTGVYSYVDLTLPRSSPDSAVGPTQQVLRVGFGAVALVVAAVGLIVTGQLVGRWSDRGAADREVAYALGLRRRDQSLARLLAALPAIALAGVLSAVGVLVGGFFAPPGQLGYFEPHPGWLAQPLLTVLAPIATAVVLPIMVVLRSRRPARPMARPARPAMGSRVAPGPVSALVLALARGRGSRVTAVRVRSAIAALTVVVAMIVVVFAVSERLTGASHTPARWGWTADFGVGDPSALLLDRLQSDPRTRDIDSVSDAPLAVRFEGRGLRLPGYGRHVVKGSLPYTVSSGRLPRADGEIALGPNAAQALGADLGERVTLVRTDGRTLAETVVGIAVLPTIEGEPLGRNAMLTATALRTAALSTGYSNLYVRATDAGAVSSLRAQIASGFQIEMPAVPATVQALDQLTTPGWVLLIVLAAAIVLLLAEQARQLVRRRGTQMWIAASIGMTRAQLVAAAACSMIVSVVIAVVLGLPLGWAISRVAIGEVSPHLGLAYSSPGLAAPAGAAGVALGLAGLGALVMALVRVVRAPGAPTDG